MTATVLAGCNRSHVGSRLGPPRQSAEGHGYGPRGVRVLPTIWSLLTFLVGWGCGWFLLWRVPRLPAPSTQPPRTRAVVVPARDEAANLTVLLPSVAAQLRPGDELVVVEAQSGLAQRLRDEPDWKADYEDDLAVVFSRET